MTSYTLRLKLLYAKIVIYYGTYYFGRFGIQNIILFTIGSAKQVKLIA